MFLQISQLASLESLGEFPQKKKNKKKQNSYFMVKIRTSQLALPCGGLSD